MVLTLRLSLRALCFLHSRLHTHGRTLALQFVKVPAVSGVREALHHVQQTR